MVRENSMWNDIDYEFVELGLPNLGWLRKKDGKDTKPVSITPKLLPLALEAAKKFPKWKFCGHPNWAYDDKLEVGSLNVYEGREKLGSIGITSGRSGTKYVVNCARISAKRKRGNAQETGDLKKAVAAMAKNFGTATHTEKMREVHEKLGNQLVSGYLARERDYQGTMRNLHRYMEPYIFEHLDEIVEAVNAKAPSKLDPEVIKNLKEEQDMVKEISDKHRTPDGVAVLITDNAYILSESANDAPIVLKAEQLPEAMRRNLGMLKLLDDGHFLAGVGYRSNSSMFFVLVGAQT
jgi:hypothetical protein